MLNVDLVDETVKPFLSHSSPSCVCPMDILFMFLPFCSLSPSLSPSLPLFFFFPSLLSPSLPSFPVQGEIRAFGFNEVADKMQAQLEMGQVRFGSSFSPLKSSCHDFVICIDLFMCSSSLYAPSVYAAMS